MKTSSRYSVPVARFAYALSWTTLVVVALLKPGNDSKHEMSFNDFVTSFFSLSIGRWDLIEAVYHVVMFAILAALWFWALVTRLPRNRALLVSAGIAVALGAVTEIGQYFVHRSSMIFDVMADYLGVALCVVWLNSLNQS